MRLGVWRLSPSMRRDGRLGLAWHEHVDYMSCVTPYHNLCMHVRRLYILHIYIVIMYVYIYINYRISIHIHMCVCNCSVLHAITENTYT